MKGSKCFFIVFGLVAALTTVPAAAVEDQIELDTTRIKTNDELPGILYLVPWKDIEPTETRQQKLTLHNFFGDLYDPVLPAYETLGNL